MKIVYFLIHHSTVIFHCVKHSTLKKGGNLMNGICARLLNISVRNILQYVVDSLNFLLNGLQKRNFFLRYFFLFPTESWENVIEGKKSTIKRCWIFFLFLYVTVKTWERISDIDMSLLKKTKFWNREIIYTEK